MTTGKEITAAAEIACDLSTIAIQHCQPNEIKREGESASEGTGKTMKCMHSFF